MPSVTWLSNPRALKELRKCTPSSVLQKRGPLRGLFMFEWTGPLSLCPPVALWHLCPLCSQLRMPTLFGARWLLLVSTQGVPWEKHHQLGLVQVWGVLMRRSLIFTGCEVGWASCSWDVQLPSLIFACCKLGWAPCSCLLRDGCLVWERVSSLKQEWWRAAFEDLRCNGPSSPSVRA